MTPNDNQAVRRTVSAQGGGQGYATNSSPELRRMKDSPSGSFVSVPNGLNTSSSTKEQRSVQ